MDPSRTSRAPDHLRQAVVYGVRTAGLLHTIMRSDTFASSTVTGPLFTPAGLRRPATWILHPLQPPTLARYLISTAALKRDTSKVGMNQATFVSVCILKRPFTYSRYSLFSPVRGLP